MHHFLVHRCRKLWKLITVYSFKSKHHMQPRQQACMWILSSFRISLFISKCIIHRLYLSYCALPYVLGTNAFGNVILQLLLLPYSDWQAFSEGFVWIWSLHLGGADETRLGTAPFITAAFLKGRYFIINTAAISKHVLCCISVVPSVEYRYKGRKSCKLWVYGHTPSQ